MIASTRKGEYPLPVSSLNHAVTEHTSSVSKPYVLTGAWGSYSTAGLRERESEETRRTAAAGQKWKHLE